MASFRVPLSNPQPDCERFVRVLMGQEEAERPPLVEYIVDGAVMRPIVEELMGRQWVPAGGDRADQAAYWDQFIEFWYRMGYDFVRLEISLPFPAPSLVADDPAPGVQQKRSWRDQHHGAITSWEDFERYPWPRIEDVDFFALEYINDHLPEGMGLMSSHGGGPYEHLSAIMSYEGLCFALMDDPELVAAVAERIGALMEQFYHHLLELDRLIAVFPGDDMGFRSSTLISPEGLKRLTLPWHKRFCTLAHEKGLPYFLHSCGNVESLMDYLIDEIGIDGKHSFEDAIMPAAEAQRRWGDRIAILGGVDVDVLGRCQPDDVRRYVRGLIEECAPRGRFAVGSGNSIPSYVPVVNYLTLLDEALR